MVEKSYVPFSGPFPGPHWRDLVWFYEYFHGDTGRGLGANHQTGWTALVARMLEGCAGKRGTSPKEAVAAGR